MSAAAPAPPAPPSPPRAKRRQARAFVLVWTCAVLAASCAFIVELSLRGKTIALGYELGRARSEELRLREVKRVLSVEASSYKTPERVEVVARTLLGMEQPGRDRVIALGPLPKSSAPKPTVARARAAGGERAAGAERAP